MDWRSLEHSLRPIIGGLVLLMTLVVLLGGAVRDPRPHDLPVGLSVPAPMAEQLSAAFDQAAPGAFTFTTYPSESEARSAIARQETGGALVIADGAPLLIVAGAAGDAVSGGLTAAFSNVFRAQGTELAVEVVHPFSPGDAHGIVLFFVVLATMIASVVAGAATVLAARDGAWLRQATVVVVYSASAGILGALTADWLVGGYGGGLPAMMGLVGLLALAVSAVIAASARLWGAPGVALSGFIVVLLGIISAGGPLGSAFLPDAYRLIAPWLPAEPAYAALRAVLYFDGSGAIWPMTLLAAYGLVGIAALAAHGMPRPVAARTSLTPA